MLLKIQLLWVGNVSSVEDHLPKIVLDGELPTDYQKRYNDSLKRSLTTYNTDKRQCSTQKNVDPSAPTT